MNFAQSFKHCEVFIFLKIRFLFELRYNDNNWLVSIFGKALIQTRIWVDRLSLKYVKHSECISNLAAKLFIQNKF